MFKTSFAKGASKQRVWKYWVLGWAGLACAWSHSASGETTPASASDTTVNVVAVLRIVGSAGGSVVTVAGQDPTWVTTDVTSSYNSIPIFIALPDADPSGATSPVRLYSYSTTTNAQSVPPTATCPPGGTVNSGTYSRTITLTAGASCTLTVTSSAGTYANIVYTATLSRTGDIYSLSAGTVCGSPFTACSTPPVSASIGLDLSKQPTIFATEIEVK